MCNFSHRHPGTGGSAHRRAQEPHCPSEGIHRTAEQDGHKTDLAEKWLDILEDTLATFEHYRELILERLKEPAAMTAALA